MAEFIAKDAVLVAVRYAIRHKDCGAVIASPIYNAIESLHAVDAVEVVRCKDCRHGAKDDLDGTYQCVKDAEYDEDTNMYFGFSAWHEADFFCRYGERGTADATD